MPHFYVLLRFTRENPITGLILEFYAMLIFVFGGHNFEMLNLCVLEVYEINLFLARLFVIKESFTEQYKLSLLERIFIKGLFI